MAKGGTKMSDSNLSVTDLERLVDRHIELCELFVGKKARSGRTAPPLFTLAEGKAVAECLADLVDRALVAYEGSGFAEDTTIFALKAALVEVIAGKLD
jgi:hypothetical protein